MTVAFRPKKRLGQHFLVNRSTAERIVESVGVSSDDLVIEVGPGKGALTGFLVEKGGIVVGVEVDGSLCDQLKKTFADRESFALLETDILTLDLHEVLTRFGCKGAVVVGNLPYNITSPLLFKLIENRNLVKTAVLMVQKEVARRMIAPVGDKAYGILSVAVRMWTLPKLLFNVSKGSFRPRPKVDSSVVRLEFLGSQAVDVQDEEFFWDVVRKTFGQRRKMLKNSIPVSCKRLSEDKLLKVSQISQIDLKRRPESLNLQEFARLSYALKEVTNSH